MALSLRLQQRCLLIALIFFTTSRRTSGQDPVEVVAKAIACLNLNSIYLRCEESYRLTAQGTLNVPFAETDAYCRGPCMRETYLVMNCIDGILYNFRFYNGASTKDVRRTIRSGCGRSHRRGDFNVLERLNSRWVGDYDGYYGDYDRGNRLSIPMLSLVLITSCALLLWEF